MTYMNIAARIQRHLNDLHICYKELLHQRTASLEHAAEQCQINSSQVARTVLLKDHKGIVMVVLALGRMLDLKQLNKKMRRELLPVSGPALDRIFPDCEPGVRPPFGQLYHVPTIVDASLLTEQMIYMEAGSHTCLISVKQPYFKDLFDGTRSCTVSVPIPDVALQPYQRVVGCDQSQLQPEPCDDQAPEDVLLSNRLQQLYKLPAMPTVANRVMALMHDDDATAAQLAKEIEQDPALTAQVLRVAASALYHYQGELDSVETAIVRVLGMEAVSNMVVGLAIGHSFAPRLSGPLGIEAFWKHAIYNANYSQLLARYLLKQQKSTTHALNPSKAYLSGLLHNIGIMLLAELFQPEFFLLNRMVQSNPDVSLPALEKKLLCMGQAQKIIQRGHAGLGQCLMRYWQMPDYLSTVAAMHHCPNYQGSDAIYVWIVQLVNHLLARQQMGDVVEVQIPEALLQQLQLELHMIENWLIEVEPMAETLDELVQGMCPA